MKEIVKLFQGWGPEPTIVLLLGALALVLTVSVLFATSVRLGPLAIELRRTTRELDELSIAMAESRIVELEVTTRQFVTSLNQADKKDLQVQTEKLKAILAKLQKRT